MNEWELLEQWVNKSSDRVAISVKSIRESMCRLEIHGHNRYWETETRHFASMSEAILDALEQAREAGEE